MSVRFSALWLGLSLGFCPGIALAQSIAVTPDGTGTIVEHQGDTYHIHGGTQAGANLFHSFRAFGLQPSEIAHFLTQPAIQNVLGRVTGGEPSVVEGLIRLTGSAANLYLLNPAGWVFTAGASLDVPGSFHLSTANQVGFADGVFDAIAPNDYAALVGAPTGWVFTDAQSGFIAHAAEVQLAPGETWSAIAPTVTQTGNVTTPGGNILIAALPQPGRLKIAQPGSLLSLEVTLPPDAIAALRPVDLPALLTGNVSPTAGTVAVRGGLNVQTAARVAPGAIQVFGAQVDLTEAWLDASGATGGDIRIGGDFYGTGTGFNAQLTRVDAATVLRADGVAGDGGAIAVWSDAHTDFAGSISAQGGALVGNGGFVEVSGKQTLAFSGRVNTWAPHGQTGTLLLDPADLEVTASSVNSQLTNVFLTATNQITFNEAINLAAPGISLTAQSDNRITVNADITTNNGNVTLNATGELAIHNADITTGTGAIALFGTGENGAIDGGTGGTGIFLNHSSLNTTSGNITLTGIGGAGGDGQDQLDGITGGKNNLGGVAGSPGGTGGTGGIGIRLVNSQIVAESGFVALNGTGGTGGMGGDGGGGKGGGSNTGSNIPTGGLGGQAGGAGGNGVGGSNANPGGGGTGGAAGGGHGTGGFNTANDYRGGGGGGGGGVGGVGGSGSSGFANPVLGSSGTPGGSGGGGASTATNGGGAGGFAGYGGGGGASNFGGNGGNGGNGFGLGGNGGTNNGDGGNGGIGSGLGGMGTGGGADGLNGSVTGQGGDGGNGGLDNNGGGGGGAGGQGGQGGQGGVAIALESGSILTAANHLTLNGIGGTGGMGGHGGGGGGGGRGVGGGGGGSGGQGGTGGTGGYGIVQGANFWIRDATTATVNFNFTEIIDPEAATDAIALSCLPEANGGNKPDLLCRGFWVWQSSGLVNPTLAPLPLLPTEWSQGYTFKR